MQRKTEPPKGSLDWQIKYRTELQNLLLDLYKILPADELGRQYSAGTAALKEIEPLGPIYGQVIGVGFSLWRAVFLTDEVASKASDSADRVEGHWEMTLKFLEVVIRENAVSFTTARRYRLWT